MKDLCFIGLDTQHQEQDVLVFLDESETNRILLLLSRKAFICLELRRC